MNLYPPTSALVALACALSFAAQAAPPTLNTSPYAVTPFSPTPRSAAPTITPSTAYARPSNGSTATPASNPRGHDCLIEPYQRIELRSPVEALIKHIAVDRGSVVQKGQVLVELDSGPELAALAAAQYRSKMQGQVKSAESRFAYAGIKHRRRDELAQKNFVSAQDRDEAFAEKQIAEGDMIEAKDNRQLAAIEAQRLSAQLEQRRLRSPFNGVVTDRMRHPGEMAQTGENAGAIMKLAQINPLRVEVVLPVAFYGNIKPGAIVTVEPEPPLKGEYRATVKIVDKVVDSASGTLGVRLELPNPDGSIPAGVKCRVKF